MYISIYNILLLFKEMWSFPGSFTSLVYNFNKFEISYLSLAQRKRAIHWQFAHYTTLSDSDSYGQFDSIFEVINIYVMSHDTLGDLGFTFRTASIGVVSVLVHCSQLIDWVRFNVPPNTLHAGHIGDGFLRVKWPNQQCQSTEGTHKTKLNQIEQKTTIHLN